MLTLVVAVALSLVFVLVVHEAGHALAAALLGGRRLRLRARPWGAAVEAELPGDRRLPFVLAGPLASVLVGLALLAAGGILVVPGALSVAFALLCLVPHGRSDGALALSLVRSRPRG